VSGESGAGDANPVDHTGLRGVRCLSLGFSALLYRRQLHCCGKVFVTRQRGVVVTVTT